ncbi:MAG: inositol monophosphatase family protein, partial [Candidatus Nanohaloarchaea archaeon]
MDTEQALREFFPQAEELYRELSSQEEHRENLAEGDIVTRVDREMTDLVIDHFSQYSNSVAFQSEELNKTGRDEQVEDPEYTVIFDEIDGTGNLRDGVGPFGTIVGIAKGSDPAFNDVIASGYLDLKNGTRYEAYRDRGAFRTSGEETMEIETSQRKELEGD